MNEEQRIAELKAELIELERSVFRRKVKEITDLIEEVARDITIDNQRNVKNIKYFLKGREGNIDIASFLDSRKFIQFRYKRGRCWKLPSE